MNFMMPQTSRKKIQKPVQSVRETKVPGRRDFALVTVHNALVLDTGDTQNMPECIGQCAMNTTAKCMKAINDIMTEIQ